MAYGRVNRPGDIHGADADRHQREEMEIRAWKAVENDYPVHRDRIAGAVKSAGEVLVDGSRRSLAYSPRAFPIPHQRRGTGRWDLR